MGDAEPADEDPSAQAPDQVPSVDLGAATEADLPDIGSLLRGMDQQLTELGTLTEEVGLVVALAAGNPQLQAELFQLYEDRARAAADQAIADLGSALSLRNLARWLDTL